MSNKVPHYATPPTGSVGIQWASFAHSNSGPLCFGYQPHLVVPATASTRCRKVTAEAREDARQVNISARQTAERLRFASLISPRCRSQTLTGGEQMGGILRQLSRDNGQLVHNDLAHTKKNKNDRCLPEKRRLYFRSRNCAVIITLKFYITVAIWESNFITFPSGTSGSISCFPNPLDLFHRKGEAHF